MEKRVLYGLVVMLMYLVGSGFSQGEVKWLSEEVEWRLTLIKAQLPIVVTLTSSLCGTDPCAVLDDQVARLAETYDKLIIFYKVDILKKPFFAKLYKVVNVPTLIIFKGGVEIRRLEKFSWGAIYDLIEASLISSAPSSSPPFG